MRLTRRERAFAEEVFAAILPGDPTGLRPFGAIDTAAFWRCLEEDGAPTLAPGLRAMLAAVWAGPLFDRRFRRPFPWLSTEARVRWLGDLQSGSGRLGRQLVATLKILACFAWLDDADARRRAGAP